MNTGLIIINQFMFRYGASFSRLHLFVFVLKYAKTNLSIRKRCLLRIDITIEQTANSYPLNEINSPVKAIMFAQVSLIY